MKPNALADYKKWSQNVFVAQIDILGRMSQVFAQTTKLQGCLFVLCTRGECTFNIYATEYKMKEGCLVTILPNSFVRMGYQSPDCRLFILGFDHELLNNSYIFSTMVDYIPFIFESPVIELDKKSARVVEDYIWVMLRANGVRKFVENKEFVSTVLNSFIYGLGRSYELSVTKDVASSRGREIVKKLSRLIIANYTKERSPAFYADLLHLTPQHLSTTVSKVTGKKVTDIIAQLVIIDAQAKLRSTNLSIQEVAYSLNFPNVSFFGKYFKRYTGLSPRAFRENDLK